MKNNDIKTHLKDRGVHDESLYHFGLDNLVVFYLWDFTGKLTGYCNYRRYGIKDSGKNDPYDGKYFIRPLKYSDGVRYSEPMWGLHSTYYSNTLFVTEGLFDAARVQEAGFASYCCFSNDPKNVAWLKLVRKIRPVVMVCDGDSAGRKLAKSGHMSLTLPDGKDANDFSANELKKMLDKF